MKENLVDMAMLYDFYGDVLTEKQREYFEYYHHDDLSLSEISENMGITRQGVRDIVTRAENGLRKMEERLGLVKRYQDIQDGIAVILANAEGIAALNEARFMSEELRDAAQRITDAAHALQQKDL